MLVFSCLGELLIMNGIRLGSDEGLSELRVWENMHLGASTLEPSSIRLCALNIAWNQRCSRHGWDDD